MHCNAAGRFRRLPKAIATLQRGFKSLWKPLQRCSKVSNHSGSHCNVAARFQITLEGHCNAAARFQITLEAIATLQRGFKSLWKSLQRCSKVSNHSGSHYNTAARFQRKYSLSCVPGKIISITSWQNHSSTFLVLRKN